MKLRKFAKKDVKEIAKLMLEEFSKPPFKEKANMASVIKSLNFYFKIGTGFVAIENKKIVGTVIFKVEQWWQGPVIIMEYLAVNENFKKQGIGKLLTERVEDYAKKIKAKIVSFKTHKKSSAVKFYSKQGYKISNDTLVMWKRIT